MKKTEGLKLIRRLYAIDHGRHPLWKKFLAICKGGKS